MDILAQDLRYAYRSLRRTPGFTFVVFTVMALAIGVNAMIFSMVYGLLIRPWPLPDSQRIVVLSQADTKRSNEGDEQFSFPDFLDLRARAHSFSAIGGEWGTNGQVTIGSEAERMNGMSVTSGLFEATGVTPALGRGFRREEEVWGKNWDQVVISDRIWRERFHSDPQVLGRTMKVNARVRAIVGVMPPGYQFPEVSDFWIPAGYDVTTDKRTDDFLKVVARLAPGVTPEQARAEMQTILGGIAAEHPELKRAYAAKVEPLTQAWNKGVRPLMALMLAAVLFVLVIACANVANLMLARAATRRREISLRLALGAPRRRIVRQLLTESLLLALVAAFAGLLLAHWGNKLWIGAIPLELPFYMRFIIDGPVIAYTAGVTVLAALLFGLAPAAFATDRKLANALREGSLQSGGSRNASLVRQSLVVAEVVLSLVLLIGTGLMLRSFQKVAATGERLAVRGGLTGEILLPIAAYPDDESRRQFMAKLEPRVRAIAGVRSVAWASQLPLDRDSHLRRVQRPGDDAEKAPRAETATASPGYFSEIGMSVKRGREFTPADGPKSPRVVVINESLAARLWPNADPLGRSLRFTGDPDSLGYASVIGVVNDVPQNIEGDGATGVVFVAQAQAPEQSIVLLLHGDADPGTMSAGLRAAVRGLDPDMPVMNLRTLEAQFAFNLWVRRLFAGLMAVFGVIALIIAAVGLYGVMAYSVAQRTQEIGVRMALGAARQDVVRMVVGQAMKLTVIGCAGGLLVALLVTRFMATLLFQVSPTDPPTYAVVAVILAASGLLAAWVPALRATRVDPMVALRCD